MKGRLRGDIDIHLYKLIVHYLKCKVSKHSSHPFIGLLSVVSSYFHHDNNMRKLMMTLYVLPGNQATVTNTIFVVYFVVFVEGM